MKKINRILPETQDQTSDDTQVADVLCEEAPQIMNQVFTTDNDEATELERTPVVETTTREKTSKEASSITIVPPIQL